MHHISIPEVMASKKSYMCDQCGKNLATKFTLERHRLSHQPPSLPCIVCDKVFREEWARKRHMLTHTADGACVCPTCGDVFSTKFSLTRHENQVHKSVKDYKCEQCNATFCRKEKLNLHLQGHAGEKPFQCDTCSKKYLHKKSLANHRCQGVPKSVPQCLVCGKMFKLNKYLKQHLAVHAAPKKQCDICGRQFTWAASLKKHLNM